MREKRNFFSEFSFLKPPALLLALFILTSCVGQQRPVNSLSASDAEIARDLSTIPQDPFYFAFKDGKEAATAPLLEEQHHKEVAARAIERFFSPWAQTRPSNSLSEAMWGYYWLKPERGFMENLRPYTQERWTALAKNSDPLHYPSRALPAITVDAADLRLMPTNTPYFFSPARPGQGYPFDYYQNSTVPLGTPVFISHISEDRTWALVETPSAGGWVAMDKLALVSSDFIVAWKSLPMGAVLRESTPLAALDETDEPAQTANTKTKGTNNTPKSGATARGGHTSAKTVKNAASQAEHADSAFLEPLEFSGQLPSTPRLVSLGTVLPMEPFPKTFGKIPAGMRPAYYPVKGPDGYALMQKVLLPESQLAPWPLPLTRENLAGMIDQMLGQPYGWGGYGGNRDCSSTLREMFISFGVWLPRNSKAQSGISEAIDLEKLSAADKESTILREGVPFLSLVGLPGHIMLYIGEYEGRAVVFHNMWGLRITQPGTNEHGRAIIGKAVITTLTPGRERKDIARPNSILESVNKLSFPLKKIDK